MSTIIGSSSSWVQSFVDISDIVLNATIRVWPTCRYAIKSSYSENEITRRLVVLLKRDPIIRNAPFFVESQLQLLPEELQGDIGVKGYLDIAVLFFSRTRKVYLALECKRLNVADEHGNLRSGANEYVLEGMMRFVRAQYAERMPLGGMIGYVMNGDVDFAHGSVMDRIAHHRRRLRCPAKNVHPGLPPSLIKTRHDRQPKPISINHTFLPLY